MSCANCTDEDEIAYTLTAYVEGAADETVELTFCSPECLSKWT